MFIIQKHGACNQPYGLQLNIGEVLVSWVVPNGLSVKSALEDGPLKFELKGEKMKGGYAMARTRIQDDKEHWIIFKLDDNYADVRSKQVQNQARFHSDRPLFKED